MTLESTISTKSPCDLAAEFKRIRALAPRLTDDEQRELSNWANGLAGPGMARRVWNRYLEEDDRQKLGGNFNRALVKYRDAAGFWSYLRGVSPLAAVLHLIRTIYPDRTADVEYFANQLEVDYGDSRQNPEVEARRSILVMAEDPFEFYWKGKRLTDLLADHPRLQDYLIRLTKKSKRRHWLSCDDLAPDCLTNILSSRKTRLKGLPGFPSELIEQIETKVKRQRLKIDPAQISICKPKN